MLSKLACSKPNLDRCAFEEGIQEPHQTKTPASAFGFVERVAFGLTESQTRDFAVGVESKHNKGACGLKCGFGLGDQGKSIQVELAVQQTDLLIRAHETGDRAVAYDENILPYQLRESGWTHFN